MAVFLLFSLQFFYVCTYLLNSSARLIIFVYIQQIHRLSAESQKRCARKQHTTAQKMWSIAHIIPQLKFDRIYRMEMFFSPCPIISTGLQRIFQAHLPELNRCFSILSMLPEDWGGIFTPPPAWHTKQKSPEILTIKLSGLGQYDPQALRQRWLGWSNGPSVVPSGKSLQETMCSLW